MFDVEKIATNTTQSIINDLYSLGKSKISKELFKLKDQISDVFKSFIITSYQNNCTVKAFLAYDEPHPFYDIYVPIPINSSNEKLESPDSESIFIASRCICLMGSAGSGKSMLMRHLFLDAINKGKRIPIFCELRHYNRGYDDLTGMLADVFRRNDLDIPVGGIEHTARSGKFIIFFDGLDEYDRNKQIEFAELIEKYLSRFPDSRVILSSRPDYKLRAWARFQNAYMNDLEFKQLEEIVYKLPNKFDSLKSEFIERCKKNEFEKFEYFLTNPLLLCIMFLTIRRNPIIHPKISSFYNAAYEALIDLHDARKGRYVRTMESGLDSVDFERVFCAFSVISLSKNAFSFSRSEARQIAERSCALLANKFPEIEVSIEDFVYDCEKNVCLLSEYDAGLQFSHRSFQEYFAAKYIVTTTEDERSKIFKRSRFSDLEYYDSIFIRSIFEMSPAIYFKYIMSPSVEYFKDYYNIKRKYGVTAFRKLFKKIIQPSQFRETDDIGRFIKKSTDDLKIFTDNQAFGNFTQAFEIIDQNYLNKDDLDLRNGVFISSGIIDDCSDMHYVTLRSGDVTLHEHGVTAFYEDNTSDLSERKINGLLAKYNKMKEAFGGEKSVSEVEEIFEF